jgi:hypothetical protein
VMEVDTAWLDSQAEIRVDPSELNDAGLRALCALAMREDYKGAEYVEARQNAASDTSVVLLRLTTSLGQKRTINDVREVELVAVLAKTGVAIPYVYPIRTDFPQYLPHMNLNFMGHRRSLCLFDAMPDDVAHIYSPDMLIARLRWWMTESAHGELHGDDQPLDPSIAPSFFDLILPPDFDETGSQNYTAFKTSDRMISPIELVRSDRLPGGNVHQYASTIITTDPIDHGAMVDLPSNLAELMTTYEKLGVDLLPYVKEQLSGDLQYGDVARRVKAELLLIVMTPITHSNGEIGALTARAFLSRDTSLLEIGKLLGLVETGGDQMALLLTPKDIDIDGLASKIILPVNIVNGFTPDAARRASGLADLMGAGFVAIGAGALGSQIVTNCARMGLNDWCIVDDDFVMPHNLARHTALGWNLGQSKAEALAHTIDSLYGLSHAQALHEHFGADVESENLTQVISSGRRIIELSATLSVSRALAERQDILSPVTSYFVNPAGTALVEFREGEKRDVNLTEIESAYYWALYNNSELHKHLEVGGIVHVGSCRNASVTIPQHRMAMFAAIASGRLVAPTNEVDAGYQIWSTAADGTIGLIKQVVPAQITQAHHDWRISVSAEVAEKVTTARLNANRFETGGILLGSCDIANQRIFITGAMSQPRDSVAGPSYFERGGSGVAQMIMDAEQRTMQHLTYVGEWHTHPRGVRNAPSTDDKKLLAWIAERRALFVMPGVMLILGENGFRLLVSANEGLSETEFRLDTY